jgi:2-polyprenyl-6-methoxyphenol hydroxylase-like FAD-dependent oxidoreductase
VVDAIIVGARPAGAASAMLLARRGYRVLLVDKAAFPSDTLSTHQIQLTGVARLKRWGLLEQLEAAGTPAVREARFHAGPYHLAGRYPRFEGADAIYGPRRTVLDALLVKAAEAAGAEVRQRFAVSELLFDGGRVTGVRGRDAGGAAVTETARLVIGADGKHSLVAQAVAAPVYDAHEPLTTGYYSYFEGLGLDHGEIYNLDRRVVGAWPTNDGLTMIVAVWPAGEFQRVRHDIEREFLAVMDQAPHLAERVRAGRRVERFYGTADLPNFYRKPFGPGWALAGDAGLTMDPVLAQGIADALRDAEMLAEAVDAGFSGRQPLDAALASFEQQRNAATQPMYQFNLDVAAMKPMAPEQDALFAALVKNPAGMSQFLGMLSGVVPVPAFFAPGNLFKLIGPLGMGRLAWRKARAPRQMAVMA